MEAGKKERDKIFTAENAESAEKSAMSGEQLK
jgi:hypothetical protein